MFPAIAHNYHIPATLSRQYTKRRPAIRERKKMNNKPNFQTCCREVAEKMWPDVGQEYLDLVYDIHTTEITRKAAKLYADRCVEEAMGSTDVVNEYEEGFGTYGVTECCRFGPLTDENYCPNCGKKINKPTQP